MLLLKNARVYGSNNGNADCVLINSGSKKIEFVGKLKDVPQQLDKVQRAEVDCKGCHLLPGFVDGHTHIEMGSKKLCQLSCEGIATFDALRHLLLQENQRILNSAQRDAWIYGVNGPYGLKLTRALLDGIDVGDKPIFILAYDYHTAWVNTNAFVRAGMISPDRQTFRGEMAVIDTPKNSIITIGSDGFPTGELVEFEAMRRINMHMPVVADPPDKLQRGLNTLAQQGITTIHNMGLEGNAAQYARLKQMEDDHSLTCRVYMGWNLNQVQSAAEQIASVRELIALRDMVDTERQGKPPPLVKLGLVKIFVDGVAETRTHLCRAKYCKLMQQGNADGEAHYTRQDLYSIIYECHANNLQCAFHCCGEGAPTLVLDCLEDLLMTNKVAGKGRFRIEHCEQMDEADIKRMASLGVVASMQPLHCPASQIESQSEHPVWVQSCKESGRLCNGFCWKKMLDNNVTLVLGSDWPIASCSVTAAICRCCCERCWHTEDKTLTDERLPVSVAVDAYTKNGAFVEFEEHTRGEIKEGYLADLVLLDGDINGISPATKLNVLMTIVDGNAVYKKEGF